MLTLDAINDMIGWLGESPIDGDDPDFASHPLYESALRILNTTNETIQSIGWWFNTVQRTLTPSAHAIAFASDVLTVTVIGSPHSYTIRDGALYDLTSDTAVIDSVLTATVRLRIPFEDLPETAADYIKSVAALRFVKAYDGDRGKVADVKEEVAKAFIPFNTDNIRNAHVNLYQIASISPILANNWYNHYRIR